MARPRAVPRSPQLAWLITVALSAMALSLSVVTVAAVPRPFGEWSLALLYLVLYWAADVTVLRIEVRRQVFAVSLAEVPLLLGLFFLPPLTVVLVRLVAAALGQAWQRVSPVKACFNVAACAAGTALAGLVVRAQDPNPVAVEPASWLLLAAAVTLKELTVLAAVIGVVNLVQGRMSRGDLIRTVVSCLLVAEINVVIGLIVVLVLHATPWGLTLLAGLGVVFVMAYRAYAMFLRQHKSLSELYDLTQAVSEGGRDGTVMDVLLSRTRKLLRAEYATLWLPASGRYPEVLLSARTDYRGLLDAPGTPDLLRAKAMETGQTVAVGPKLPDEHLLPTLREKRTKGAVVVPLRSGDVIIGTLEVAGRLGDRAHFGPDDVRLLETVAAHASVAVENSRLVDRLRFDAQHDALTGLPNRRRILNALDEAIKVQTPEDVVAVLLFDVARLRQVNESLGHGAGDKLLAEFARRLRELAPPAALVGRIGGNEFAVTVRTAGAEEAVGLAAKIRESVQGRKAFGALSIDVDCVVGVAVHPDHGADSATLLQHADVATYAAKIRHSSVQLFSATLESRSARRVGLAGDLRRALDEGQLQVYFQPKVNLRDRRLVGVECLSRWNHPVHGPVAPQDFVAVAEHTGQLGRLTEVVLREGLRRAREWEDAGREFPVSVNLSPRTLVDPAFPSRVAAVLGEYAVDPGLLTLEITEGGVVGDPDRALATLRALRDLGVRLSVDDFGTGFSSLGYLRRLPVQEVKIDRTFVEGMATDPGDLAIVRTIVDMSRHFGLSVVAEGVESELTLGLLEEIGCDVGQGFLFSRPLPYERLDAWYAAQMQAEPTPAGEVRWLRAVP
ncbi:sensor domain-containing phosphodiesterase [Planosporangium thailandense]|uniref:Sensor domain-containing phosphodiesterase n=1 Tax=Planosporangium thailandense TaxID=765197 RepID=A0ABX0XVP6_9ACTN|nr:sensor domain-containing phosphodiesterase [Planosporangium thailandense]NJC70111.1 sensor domain-containing phosphodiesterase [Planosporangium thailandense]